MGIAETKNGIWFSIHIEKEEFVAFITADALSAGFQKAARATSRLGTTYKKNQQAIEDAAKRKFLSGALRPVQLTAADFSLAAA